MEKVKILDEITPEQELRNEINNFIDFLDKIYEKTRDMDLDSETALTNMHKIFTKDRIEHLLNLMENLEVKAGNLKNNNVKKIFVPLNSGLSSLKYALEKNLYDNVSKDFKINMGAKIYQSMVSLIAARDFFSKND